MGGDFQNLTFISEMTSLSILIKEDKGSVWGDQELISKYYIFFYGSIHFFLTALIFNGGR